MSNDDENDTLPRRPKSTANDQSSLPIDEQDTIKDFVTIEYQNLSLATLYFMEVWRGKERINEHRITKHEITVGRDTADCNADVRLISDNQKISRIHASIALAEHGKVQVTSLGLNPTVVSGHTILKDEQAQLARGDEIQIYEFILRLRFSE